MRTDTCERDNEPVDIVHRDDEDHKEHLDSSLCRVESVACKDDELHAIETVGSSPKHLLSLPNSPLRDSSLLYIPEHSRLKKREINNDGQFNAGFGRPILIASLEDDYKNMGYYRKDSDVMSASSSEVNHQNLSLTHDEHQSLSPEKGISNDYHSIL